jgi:hypothetical protein
MPNPCLVEVNPPWTGWDWHITHAEDLNDPLPQFLAADGGPLNLTGKVVDVYIRPTYDHSTLIKKLTSTASAGVIIDNAAQGLCTAFLARATVQADIPVSSGKPGHWDFFVSITDTGTYEEFARGPFYVHAGRTAA